MLKLDIAKAYDSVDRSRLWQLMSHIGAECPLLSLIRVATEGSRVRLASSPDMQFTTSVGVKQGCPASPTLFNTMLTGLQAYLAAVYPHAGVHLSTTLLQALTYADDITLLAEDTQHLADLLTGTIAFLRNFGLQIVVKESTFYSSDRKIREFRYGENNIPAAERLKFLGFSYASNGLQPASVPPTAYAVDILERARATGHAPSLRILAAALRTYYQPIIWYGVEVWGHEEIVSALRKGEPY